MGHYKYKTNPRGVKTKRGKHPNLYKYNYGLILYTMDDLKRWKNQKYAVNLLRKIIFEIDDIEVIDGNVIIFAGSETNSSRNLHTVAEAHYLEEIKSIF